MDNSTRKDFPKAIENSQNLDTYTEWDIPSMIDMIIISIMAEVGRNFIEDL